MSAIALPQPDARILVNREQIIAGLAAIMGADGVIVSEDERRAFETDALTAYRVVPMAVVLPKSTEEVSAVLKFLGEQRVKVVARGAGTSLSGGAIPSQDCVVVGLSKMNRILAIDYDNRTARVEAGVTNINITNAVSGRGFFYAPDPSSQLACTIAGNIAMNSGGAHCLKYGVTRHYVLGLEAVLADGTVLRAGGRCHKNKTGFDLIGLFVGSEGLLGIVTEITLRLIPHPPLRAMLGAGFASFADAATAVQRILGSGHLPSALEISDRFTLQAARNYVGDGVPSGDAHLIVEVDGGCHARKRRADARRDEKLARLGYRILRVDAALVTRDLPAAVALVRGALAHR